jgi:Rrf2 family nitric oxide-sensitive transcriptional repressor
MQLNLTTDYAIRVVLYLAEADGLVTSQDLANFSNVSPNYIFKIMKKLVDAGYVEQFRGVKGGYKLLQDPKDISLWDIIELMEPTTAFNRCLEEDSYCSRHGDTLGCQVNTVYRTFQKHMEDYFKSYSIQRIVDEWGDKPL